MSPNWSWRFNEARSRAILGAMLCLGLSACTSFKTTNDYLISGNEAFKAGDYEAAERDYREAVKRDPEASTPLNNLGVVLNTLEKWDAAAEVLRKAVKADPKNAIAHYTLARALMKSGHVDEALTIAHEATQLAPDDLAAHRTLAETFLTKVKGNDSTADDLRFAIEEYRYIIRNDPDDDLAHQQLAEALALHKEVDSAVTEAQKAVDLNEDNFDARKVLAGLLAQKGDKTAAVTELDLVLKKNPGDAQARKLKESIETGTPLTN